MGKIYYMMGKSASGKDTLYKLLMNRMPGLKRAVIHTTRPMRDGETDGVEYFFDGEEQLNEFRRQGRIIEERTYETVMGPWTYYTVMDGQFDDGKDDILMIGTLESYAGMMKFFGGGRLVPVYIQVDGGTRLERSVRRERLQKHPNYSEICRRFLADEEDFSEEKLGRLGIERRFINQDMDRCADEICAMMRG